MTSTDQSVQRLGQLRHELRLLALNDPSVETSKFSSWHSRTLSALTKVLGADHHITKNFNGGVSWSSFVVLDDPSRNHAMNVEAFQRAAEQVGGYLEAAVAEAQDMSADSGVFDTAGVDTELWAFISTDVEGEHWGKTASQATLFLEDRIRKWSGQPAEVIGVDLMKAVLGPGGDYRIGRTDNEKDGWHQLARGIVMALRNAAAHRIEDRPDHRRYVLGVVGACSLLLTQFRYEHGNRFADPSLIEHDEEPPDSRTPLTN